MFEFLINSIEALR